MEHLVRLIRAAGNHIGTGFLCTTHLCHVLAENGRLDVAYELLNQKTIPSWLYAVTRGAMTIWETREGIKEDGTPWMSLNHYSPGAVINFLHRTVAGSEAAEPGYRRIAINPQPGGGLTGAKATYESVHGLIASEWSKENGRMRLDVTIPANTRAVVTLPGAALSQVLENGLPLSEGALEILEATNNIYFVRCADADTATDASATVSLGSCPAVAVSGNSYGLTNPLYLRIQVYNNLGVPQYADPKTFSLPANTILTTATSACQGMALTKVLGGSLDSSPVRGFYNVDTSTTGFIVGSCAGSGAYLSVSAASGTNFGTQGIPVLASLDFSGTASGTYVSSLTVWGASFNSTDISYVAQTLYPGAGYNLGTKSDGSTSGNSVEIDSLGGARVILTVNDKGVAKETYKVSLIENNGFTEDVINTGEDNAVSEIIKGELYFDGAPASPTKLTSFLDKVTASGHRAHAAQRAGR